MMIIDIHSITTIMSIITVFIIIFLQLAREHGEEREQGEDQGPTGPGRTDQFDIDDTLIYTDGTPITRMIELLHIARHLGYKIVIITARPSIQHVINWSR